MGLAEINEYGQIFAVTGRFWPVIFAKIVIQIGSRAGLILPILHESADTE